MNKLNFKIIILNFISLFYSFYLNSNKIETIKNFSKYSLNFRDKNQTFSINSKKILIDSFDIPYISIKSYIEKFVRNIPYAPEKSLKFEHNKNIFYIWKNELGVILALDPNNPENLSNWKLNIIYSNELKQSNLILLIDENNKFKLISK